MTPTPDDAHRLALSQAEHHTAAAYDSLLAVSPLALTADERARLDAARAMVGALTRDVAARRRARVVPL